MTDLSRREAIKLAAGGLVAAVAPLPALAATIKAPIAASAVLPAWAVGTPGEWDWRVIEAATELEARFAWLDDGGPGSDCEQGGKAGEREDCDCDSCSEFRGLDTDRKEHWDGKGVIAGDGMWFESGLGAYCSRCNEEAFSHDGGAVVAGEVVCGECMTLADWDIADPERAAELRAEAEEERLADLEEARA
jgi:hypothetical protein